MRIHILLCLFACLLFCGCSDTEKEKPKTGNAKLLVYTTFYPTYFFASSIGGDLIDVVNPVPPGEDPIFWIPPSDVLRKYQSADLIVLNGASFAKWVKSAMFPEDKVLNAGEDFEDDLIILKNAMVHSHGDGKAHSHEGIDGHTWLDAKVAMGQCQKIKDALIKQRPEHREAFEKNAQALIKELNQVHERLIELSKALKGKPMLASHPAYNYLARRYEWDVFSFDLDPETELAPDNLIQIKTHLAKNPDNLCLLWESEPLQELKDLFANTFQIKSILFSPVETQPEDGRNYLEVMDQNLKNLESVLKQ